MIALLRWKWHKWFRCPMRRSRVGGSVYFVWYGYRICDCGHYIDGGPPDTYKSTSAFAPTQNEEFHVKEGP